MASSLFFLCTLLCICLVLGAHNSSRTLSKGCTASKCDFDPVLLGGNKGYPGLRTKANSRMFRYASALVGEILNREIQRARLPNVAQSTKPLLDGYFELYNGYVSKFRCPERVVVFPKAPNQVVLQIQNLDVGLTGTLAGEVRFNIPYPVTGHAHISLQGTTVQVEVGIARNKKGSYVKVNSCKVNIKYVKVSIEKGGIFGSMANTFYKKSISELSRTIIPGQLCRMIPNIVKEQINNRAAAIPQIIGLNQIMMFSGGVLSSDNHKPDPEFCEQECGINITDPKHLHVHLPPIDIGSHEGNSKRIRRSSESSSTTSKTIQQRSATELHRPRMSSCESCAAPYDPNGMMKELTKTVNLSRINDMYISMFSRNTKATNIDFTTDVSGEFSPGGRGGTPFGPYPIIFPSPFDDHMIEVIVSDFTINSLLYWMHKKKFLSFPIGPEHPKLGGLLKTTCGGADDDEFEKRKKRSDEDIFHRRWRKADVFNRRIKRQDIAGGLNINDLGICLGDILPALHEAHPNKNVTLQVHSTRAPSVILYQKRGGMAKVDVRVEGDLYIDGTKSKVGTLTITAIVNVALQFRGNKLYGKGEISTLKLADKTGELGLPEDTAQNLSDLGKDLITKFANDALKKGVALNLEQSPGLLITIYNPHLKIIEHALHVAVDITVAPAVLGTITGATGQCYLY